MFKITGQEGNGVITTFTASTLADLPGAAYCKKMGIQPGSYGILITDSDGEAAIVFLDEGYEWKVR